MLKSLSDHSLCSLSDQLLLWKIVKGSSSTWHFSQSACFCLDKSPAVSTAPLFPLSLHSFFSWSLSLCTNKHTHYLWRLSRERNLSVIPAGFRGRFLDSTIDQPWQTHSHIHLLLPQWKKLHVCLHFLYCLICCRGSRYRCVKYI